MKKFFAYISTKKIVKGETIISNKKEFIGKDELDVIDTICKAMKPNQELFLIKDEEENIYFDAKDYYDFLV